MSRIIKHKAWDVFNKRWLNNKLFAIDMDGNLINKKCAGIIGGCVIVEFTGLLDKHGKEIYGGDILSNSGTTPRICEVYFDEIQVFWAVRYNPHDFDAALYIYIKVNTSKNKHDIEIIGNIHENPELLNPKK